MFLVCWSLLLQTGGVDHVVGFVQWPGVGSNYYLFCGTERLLFRPGTSSTFGEALISNFLVFSLKYLVPLFKKVSFNRHRHVFQYRVSGHGK